MNLLELRVFWGKVLLRVEHVRYPWRVTIGQGRGVDVFVASDDLASDSYELVRTEGEACVIAVARGMTGEIERDGHVEPLTGTSCTLDPEGRSIVCWGGLTFAMRFVSAETAVPRFAWRDIDHELVRPLVVSFCGHMAAIVTLLLMPYATESLHEDLRVIDRIAELMPPPPAKVATPQKVPVSVATRAPRAPSAIVSRSGSANVAGRIQSMLDHMAFSGSPGGGIARDLGALIGSRGSGPSPGLLGLGTRGGFGGIGGFSGQPAASLDIGSIPGLGPSGAPREQRLRAHQDHAPIDLKTPDVTDALSREAIRKVVDRNRGQVRYCYERELQAHQDLEGRIAMRWIVAATGSVVRVEVVESSLPSQTVAACLRDAIMSWRFPEPAGGGVVTVAYPFVFRAN